MTPPKPEKKETPRYDYRVLYAEPTRHGDDVIVIFVPLGTFKARTPDEAIEQATEADRLPDKKSTVVAVPMSRWNERRVEPRTIRLWDISKPQGQLPSPPEEAPPPSPESPPEPGEQWGDSSVTPGEFER